MGLSLAVAETRRWLHTKALRCGVVVSPSWAGASLPCVRPQAQETLQIHRPERHIRMWKHKKV